jgi:hypothetical protein
MAHRWKLSLLGLVLAALAGCGGGSDSSGYPSDVRANFLKACEVKGSDKVCNCTLSWFEKHISLKRFEAADDAVRRGKGAPQWMYTAARACVKKT